MERFYIVTNKEILDAVAKYHLNKKANTRFINEFFDKHGIDGNTYYLGGNGRVGVPFEEYNKKDITLYIENTENNISKFGHDFKKNSRYPNLSELKKTSKLLKAFQDECVSNKVIVNLEDVNFGEYFKGLHWGGYIRTYFEVDDVAYLSIQSTNGKDIIPEVDELQEIKGSEFYIAYEKRKEQDRM